MTFPATRGDSAGGGASVSSVGGLRVLHPLVHRVVRELSPRSSRTLVDVVRPLVRLCPGGGRCGGPTGGVRLQTLVSTTGPRACRAEIYRTLPVREEVLRAVLGADLIGFHTYDYARHFISSCTRILGLEGTPEVRARGLFRPPHTGVLLLSHKGLFFSHKGLHTHPGPGGHA